MGTSWVMRMAGLGVALTIAVPVRAGTALIGHDGNGTLYTINPATAQLSNPRAMGIAGPVGIALTADNTVYALSSGPSSALYTVNPITGATTFVGNTALSGPMTEGDLVWGGGNTLFATYRSAGTPSLISIDRTTGAATVVGPITGVFGPADDVSGLAFRGTRFLALDTNRNGGNTAVKIYDLDSSTGAITATLSTALDFFSGDDLAALAVHPDTNAVYMAGGSAPNRLYTVNLTTGVSTVIGDLATPNTIAGLRFIPDALLPDPSGAGILLIGMIAALGRGSMQARPT